MIRFLLASLLVFSACAPPEGPREREQPRFEARLAFEELTEPSERPSVAPDEFEERIARARGAEPAKPKLSRTQTIPLGDDFVADLPEDFGRWTWSHDQRSTLAVLQPSTSAPAVAMIYAEPFSSRFKERPSSEMKRFQRTVDPALAQPVIPASLRSIAASHAGGPNLDSWLKLAEGADSRTLGTGLAYRADPGTFSGWKWLGISARDVDLRFGRTRGTWTDEAAHDSTLQSTLDVAADRVPALLELADAYRTMARRLGEQRSEPEGRPAWMLVGAASLQGRGTHLAIICQARPRCEAADDLVAFLQSVRPADRDARARIGQPSRDPAAMGAELGLPLLPSDLSLRSEDIEKLLAPDAAQTTQQPME